MGTRRCVAVFLALVASGCTREVWVKSGATQADFGVAKARCIAAAYSSVPAAPAMATIGGGYTSPLVTNCSGYGMAATCVTTGGQYTPPVSIPYDANSGARNEVFKGCMYSDGWSLETESIRSTAEPQESDWTKGYNFGLHMGRKAQCDSSPSRATTSDWKRGCEIGRMK